MVELGNFLNNTLQGRLVCVFVICLAVYITATRKGSLEEQIKRLRSIALYLTNVVVIASLLTLLGLVGLLKPVSGLAIVMTLSISEALIGLSRLKFEEYYREYQDKGIEHGDQ